MMSREVEVNRMKSNRDLPQTFTNQKDRITNLTTFYNYDKIKKYKIDEEALQLKNSLEQLNTL